MTMPSPQRVARRSVAVLVGMGMPKADACQMVRIICDEVTGIIWRRSPDMDITWLALIAQEATVIQAGALPHVHAGACPQVTPHAAHQWWPHPDRMGTCCGHGALDRPST